MNSSRAALPSMAALEALPGYWRGKRRVRSEMMVDHGDDRSHAKLVDWYSQRINFLERERNDR